MPRYGYNPRPRYPSDLPPDAVATLRRLGRARSGWEEMATTMADKHGVKIDGKPASEMAIRRWCKKLSIPFSTNGKGPVTKD